MSNRAARIVFSALVLVLGGAAEDLIPNVGGVGAPILLAMTLFFAMRPSLWGALVFTVLAGWMEEALAGLPFLMSIPFFLAAAALARWSRLSYVVLALAYPVYEVWLAVWIPGLSGGVFGRVLFAVPFGLVTATVVEAVLSFAAGRIAIDD